MTPQVSLIIPAYNAAKFLNQTLESVSNQTLADFECIIVNDSSTDETREIANEWRKRDKRMRYIEHRVNSHVSAARNSGIRAAKGNYISFLDSDDLLMPGSLKSRLQTCIAAGKISDRYAGSYAGSLQIEESETNPPAEKPFHAGDIGFVTTGGSCPFNANQPMIRYDILRKFGGFCEAMSQSEDYNLWYRILRGGYWFAPAKTFSVTYRKRSVSLVRKAPLTHLSNALSLLKHADTHLPSAHLSSSPYRIAAPYHHYEKQKRRISRVLEFCGMEIATGASASTASCIEICATSIPDAHELIAPNRSLKELVMKGVIRSKGHATDDDHTVIEALLSSLHSRSNEPDIKSTANTAVFDDPIANMQWDEVRKARIDVAFLPHKDYHVWSIGLIADAIRSLGMNFVTVDLSPQWREAGVRQSASENKVDLIGLGDFLLGGYRPSSIVVFNDWDHVTRPIILAAQAAGISTVSIVEGIQDYLDADTGRARYAYQATQNVLLPGEFDKRYFQKSSGQTLFSVGIPRIQALRQMPTTAADVHGSRKIKVLINSNFSYGVQTEHRDQWLKEAVESTLALGMEPVISRHPADTGDLYPELVSKKDFYTLLEECDLTIQRFASGVLEALARQKVVYYYNPHKEKVDKFTADPMGAYPVIFDKNDLMDQMRNWKEWSHNVQKYSSVFLDHHAGLEADNVPLATAKALHACSRVTPTDEQLQAFLEHMKTIDEATGSLCHAVTGGKPLFPQLENAIEQLKMKTEVRQKDRTPLFVSYAWLDKLHDEPDVTISQSSHAEFMQQMSTHLLLDPLETLHRLRNDAQLAAKVDLSLTMLPEDDVVVQHFHRVLHFAESQAR